MPKTDFYSDLQDHIEDVSSFYMSTDELREVMRRMIADGHFTISDHQDGTDRD